jgi:AraC-like DNA-binding protein
MEDVNYTYLEMVVDTETAFKIAIFLKGLRVSFPKAEIEHREIKREYKELIKMRVSNRMIIKRLATKFGKSESSIYRIVKK